MKTIDPVALKELKIKTQKRVSAQQRIERSANALLWFHEYAMTGEGGALREVDPSALVGENGFGGHKCPNLIVATATSNVGDAAHYLANSYKQLRAEIIARAIMMAQDDLKDAEEIMK